MADPIKEEDAFGVSESDAFGGAATTTPVVEETEAFGIPQKTTFAEDIRIGAENVLNNILRSVGDVSLSADDPGIMGADPLRSGGDYSQGVSGFKGPEKEEAAQAAQGVVEDVLVTEDAKKKDPGVGGAVVQGLTGVAGTTAAFMVNPAMGLGMAAMQTYGQARNTYESLVKQGVSEESATKIGVMMGVSEGISQLIPGYGGAAAKPLVSMAAPALVAGGTNVVQGLVFNNYAYKVLSGDEGRPDLAEQYNPYDPKNWITDFVTGAGPVAVRTGYSAVKDMHIAREVNAGLNSIKKDLQAARAEQVQLELLSTKTKKKPVQAELEAPEPTPLEKAKNADRSQMSLLDDLEVDPLSAFYEHAQRSKSDKTREKRLDRVAELAEEERQRHKNFNDAMRAKEERTNKDTGEVLPGAEEGSSLDRFMTVDTLGEALYRNSPDINEGKAGQLSGWIAKNLASGHAGLAQLSNSSYLKHISSLINDADRKAQGFVQNRVHPLAKKFQGLDDTERVMVMRALQLGDQTQAEVTPQMMQKAGMSEKAQDFINTYYTVNKSFLNMHNANLQSVGKDLIEARPGHVPSRWNGEYVVFATNKDGKLQTVIVEPTVYQAKTAQEFLKKKDPTLKFSDISGPSVHGMRPDTLRIGLQAIGNLAKSSGNTDFGKMLKEVGKVLEAGNVESAKKLYSFDQHELAKLGVDGYLGNRKWKHDVENANDLFKSMVEYWEQGSVSSHYMSVGENIQKTITEIQDTHPNTANVMNELYNHNILQKPNDYGRTFNNVMELLGKSMGLGTNFASASSAKVGNVMQMMTLGMFNARFAAVQLSSLIQQGLPNMALVQHAVKQDPDMLMRHIFDAQIKNNSLQTFARNDRSKVFSTDEMAALKYAEDRGMLNFSEFEYVRSFGESATKRNLINAANASLAVTDRLTRPTVFIASYNMMREAGYPKKLAMETAANVTQAAMVDYRQNARAMMYNKLGVVGREASRLRTFVHGYMTNYAVLAKADKKAAALSTALLALMGGAIGIPGVELFDRIYANVTGESAFSEIENEDLRTLIEFGALSQQTGLWLHPSYSMATIFPDRQARIMDYAFPYLSKAGKGLFAAGEFMMNPNTQTAGTAAIENVPLSLRGKMVESFRREGDFRLDSKGRKDFYMSDAEWNWYRFGISTTDLGKFTYRRWNQIQKENEQKKDLAEMHTKIVDSYLVGEYKPDELRQDLVDYARAKGPEALMQLVAQIKQQAKTRELTPAARLAQSGSYSSLMTILDRARAQVLVRSREKTQ